MHALTLDAYTGLRGYGRPCVQTLATVPTIIARFIVDPYRVGVISPDITNAPVQADPLLLLTEYPYKSFESQRKTH